MKRLLRWLNPKTLLRGLVFGFLFGFLGFQAVVFGIMCQNARFESKGLPFHLFAAAGFAIPWVVIWGGTGAASAAIRGHFGTPATACAVAFAIGYSFWEGPKHLHPWLFITVPIYTFLAIIPCHLVGYAIAALLGRVRDPDEPE